MNMYEVVCTLIATHIIQLVEANDEKHARQKMWDSMSDSQKNNCSDIEVFPLEG